jgi:hypothetical protein
VAAGRFLGRPFVADLGPGGSEVVRPVTSFVRSGGPEPDLAGAMVVGSGMRESASSLPISSDVVWLSSTEGRASGV